MDINVVPVAVGNVLFIYREIVFSIIVKHVSNEFGIHVDVVHNAAANE